MMTFSEQLVNKIHTHRINPVITYILLSMLFAGIIAVSTTLFIIEFELKSPVTILMFSVLVFLLVAILLVIIIAQKRFNKSNHALGKIEDFVILHHKEINDATAVSHADILDRVTDFDNLPSGPIACDIIEFIRNRI